MDLSEELVRCEQRVASRIPDESSLKEDGTVLCPYCEEPMSPRSASLGKLGKVKDSQICIQGVRMKHAGDGCCYVANFDVPVLESEWNEIYERWNGQSITTTFADFPSEEREAILKDLGYLPDDSPSDEEEDAEE